MIEVTESLLATFDRNVSKDGAGGCWVWRGAAPGTYGRLTVRDIYRGLHVAGAHRAAWMIANGPIPAGMNVCHKCDNRSCVNPEHLFLGTHNDNMAW